MAPERAIRVERRALLAVAVLAILIATLRPGGTALPTGWSFDISSGEAALAEAIQNLLLFVPLGIALVLNGVRPLRAIAIGAGLSFSVEFLQQWIPGRDPSVGDITTNTISTALGVALVRFAPQWLMVSPSRSAWQAIGAALLTLEQPDMRWRRALAGIAPRDTFTVQAWRGEYGNCLSLNSARRCGLGYTIGDGWKLIFYPERWPGWVLGTLNSLWLAGWMAGVGYWGRRASKGGEGRRRTPEGVAIAIAIVGMLIIPPLTGLNATSINEWIGALGGMGLGY